MLLIERDCPNILISKVNMLRAAAAISSAATLFAVLLA
jgi:hypothetical protein